METILFVVVGAVVLGGVALMFWPDDGRVDDAVKLLTEAGSDVQMVELRDTRSLMVEVASNLLFDSDSHSRTSHTLQPFFKAINSEGREVEGWVKNGQIVVIGETAAQAERDARAEQIADERTLAILEADPMRADTNFDGELSAEGRRALREEIGREVRAEQNRSDE